MRLHCAAGALDLLGPVGDTTSAPPPRLGALAKPGGDTVQNLFLRCERLVPGGKRSAGDKRNLLVTVQLHCHSFP